MNVLYLPDLRLVLSGTMVSIHQYFFGSPHGKAGHLQNHASQLLVLRRELFTLWDSHNTNNNNNQNRLISKQVQTAPYMGKALQLLQAPWLGLPKGA